MLDVITVPFSHLVLRYRNIGVHRGRTWGFRDVFGFPTLRDLPFVELARRVKEAYDGREVPSHEGWPAQRDALRWLVDKGRAGIYALDQGEIEVRRMSSDGAPDTAPTPGRYYIFDGHHRALALFVLGDEDVRARINPSEWSSRRRAEAEATTDPTTPDVEPDRVVLAPNVERDGDAG